ncbi:MAG: CDP-glucose 4,6-dehydratase, partial [Coriobacteriales bacterium]|nr:CDP-glucose 4,6-dehydratase [Coriobacteriales bacterium]
MGLIDRSFFKGRRVLITGHTGFKGSWLCMILRHLGAEVSGLALDPPTDPNLFTLLSLEHYVRSHHADVRDFDAVLGIVKEERPELLLHLAAQPLVRESYLHPHATYETNVMGTLNVLEALRQTDSVRSFINVTTDKVYLNREQANRAYQEDDPLDGFDPYSNSKSCSDLITHGYRNAFFLNGTCAISVARAGNVIGGGDFAADRIIPDCIRAATQGQRLLIRNPSSTRPYQHVLEPLCAYLMIAQRQYGQAEYANYYNVGPDSTNCTTTENVVALFRQA